MAVLIVLLGWYGAGAQNTVDAPDGPGEAELVDSFEGYNEEILYKMVDGFFSKLSEDPANTGYIQVYIGVSNLPSLWNSHRTERLLSKYLSFRRFPQRITFVRAGFLQKDLVELWIVPPGAEPPPIREGLPEPKLDISKTVLFDKRLLDSDEFFPFELGSDHDPAELRKIDADNLPAWISDEFARALSDHKEARGYLIFYADPSEYDVNGLERRFAEGIKVMDDALGESGRIQLIYGGVRGATQVEYFIGPKNGSAPSPSPGEKP